MGAIEDVRKVIQDLVAPELKSLQAEVKGVDEASKLRDEALSAKIDSFREASTLRDEALSAKIDHVSDMLSAKIDHVSGTLQTRMENLSDKVDRKFEIVFAEMKANHASLIYSMNIEKRVDAIERKTAEPMHAT